MGREDCGVEAKILASACPRSRCFIMYFSGKNCVKFGNFVNFSGNNLKSYAVNHYLVLFPNYFWPQPPEIGLGLGLGLVAMALASASASRFWPRLTSLSPPSVNLVLVHEKSDL